MSKWRVSEVICVDCDNRWTATRPEGQRLSDIKCPGCLKQGFVIETGQDIFDRAYTHPPSVADIVKTYLIDNNFHGLYNPDPSLECGCLVEDLFPCGGYYDGCCPGWKYYDDDERAWSIGPHAPWDYPLTEEGEGNE